MGSTPPQISAHIGKKVHAYRAIKGMSRQELSRASGIPYSTLGKIENGQLDPKVSQLERLAEALDVEAAEFLRKEVRVGS